MANFTQSEVETGQITFTSGEAAELEDKLQVTFKRKFRNVPNVSITLSGSNRMAVANNVNTEGFELILSDSGNELTFTVNYIAVLVI